MIAKETGRWTQEAASMWKCQAKPKLANILLAGKQPGVDEHEMAKTVRQVERA